ncbi:MAG: 3-hydroxybutyrate dehydrogenase [Alphaproteobacteria bacterium]
MLKGKTALVTGSTSGIGKGIAGALAREGAKVMLNGFGEPRAIEALRAEIAGNHGVKVAYHDCDLARPERIPGLIEATERALGPVDVLVNNAGLQHVAPVEAFPPERWDAVVAVCMSAAFHTIRAALPGMRARGWGRIVNISSASGLIASVNKSAYVAAKHGVIGLTKVVALETARDGITCNAICPGWVRTPLAEWQIEARAKAAGRTVEEEAELMAGENPTHRFVTPEEIGAFTAFLCTDAAASITGAALSIDGGIVAH